MNVDRQQIEAFQRDVVGPVRAECAAKGAPHLAEPLIKDAAVATEFGKFAVHNNFWSMEGDGDTGHNLELVLSQCPRRVYKPKKRRVARFSSPRAAAREAVRRALQGNAVRPQELSMVTNPSTNNVRFAAWGGLSDILDVTFKQIGKVTNTLIEAKVADGTLTQEDAMNLKTGGSVIKELSTGGVKIYEFAKDGKGEEVLVAKDVASKAEADAYLADKEKTKGFLGLSNTQLMLGGAGLLVIIYLVMQRGRGPASPAGGFSF